MVAVSLLKQEKLLDIAINIVSGISPGISVVLVSVRPSIQQDHLARGFGIGKYVENMGQLLGGNILRLEVAGINSLMVFS
jgi:hypothetical protein